MPATPPPDIVAPPQQSDHPHDEAAGSPLRSRSGRRSIRMLRSHVAKLPSRWLLSAAFPTDGLIFRHATSRARGILQPSVAISPDLDGGTSLESRRAYTAQPRVRLKLNSDRRSGRKWPKHEGTIPF